MRTATWRGVDTLARTSLQSSQVAVTIEGARIEGLLRTIVAAANGDYDVRVVAREHDDSFLEVELGVNYLLDELIERRAQNQAQQRGIAGTGGPARRQQDELVRRCRRRSSPCGPGCWRCRSSAGSTTSGRRHDHGDAAGPGDGRAREPRDPRSDRGRRDRADDDARDLADGPRDRAARREVLLTGIGPDVAQQIVALGDGDAGFQALAQLSDALALVLADKGALRR
jgi:rsbT co-antagonist protein RsbR